MAGGPVVFCSAAGGECLIELYDLAGRDPELRFSPYCWRVRMAMAHKGLEPQTVPWRFSEASLLPGAPHNRQVPVIVDDGAVVADSTAIAFHLEERHTNGPSLFGGAGGEAHARFIIAWADTVLVPAMFPFAASYVFTQLHPADQAYFRQSREVRLGTTLEAARDAAPGKLAGLRATLAPLRRVLAGQPFAGGEEPSYADYALFGCFQWLRCVGVPDVLEAGDPVAGWRGVMLELFDGLAGRAVVA